MLKPIVPVQQIVAGTSATLSWQPTDSEGEPADPGTVTVGVTTSDGTVIHATGEATGGSTTAPRTVAVTATNTATVDHLIATWSDDESTPNVLGVTHHEIIGAPLITLAEYQLHQANDTVMDAATLIEVRRQVDQAMCRGQSSWLNRSVLPRFTVEVLDPDRVTGNTACLHYPDLRRVGWARTLDTDGGTTSITVTGVLPDPVGWAILPNAVWPTTSRIEIGYEHGYPQPPEDVKAVAAAEIYVRMGKRKTNISRLASSYTDGAGGVMTFSEVGTRHRMSELEVTNQLIRDHRWDVAGVA